MKAEGVNLNELIGLQFKRNVYGLSLWTDTIRYIGYKWKLIDREKREIVVFILGHNSDVHFSLDEIVVVNKPLRKNENAQLIKNELVETIESGGDLNEFSEKNNIKFVKPLDLKK